MIKASNKTYVFDLNNFQNKLQGSDQIRTPSTKAFQHQQFLRDKNYQSEVVKQSMQQPVRDPYSNTKGSFTNTESKQLPTTNLFGTSKSELKIPSQIVNQKSNVISNNITSLINNHHISSQNQPQKFTVSSRASMYDFRKNTSSHYSLREAQHDPRALQQHQPQSIRQTFLQQKDQPSALFPSLPQQQLLYLQKPLTPIRETQNSIIIPPSRSVQGPDNGILFLDNGSKIYNPVNVKTPPPPMWGEILEEENYDPDEDFYDHQRAEQEMRRRKQMEDKRANSQKKLKKKIVYVYESDSDEEGGGKEKIERSNPQAQSLIQQPNSANQLYPNNNRTRGFSSDQHSNPQGGQPQLPLQIPKPYQKQTNFPLIRQVGQSQKPPLPSSQLKQLPPSGRQIRTGAFQRIGLQVLH